VRSAVPVTSRRGVLVGGAALAALGVVVSACGQSSPKTSAVEDLSGPLDQANRDSALATAAAAAAGNPPQIAAALTVVATQRAAHARALATEIARAGGKVESSSTEPTNPSPSDAAAQPPAPPPPTTPLSDVVNSLRTSAENASRLATTSSGYQAGLLGSISASCTVSYSIALVPAGPTP
jgi:hypothetical protein